jgi:hydrogenase nickel incorporation protein HypA/HybF
MDSSARSDVWPTSPVIAVHEFSIVEALIDQVEKEVESAGLQGRVLRLELVVGRLSGVNIDSIRFAFEILSPTTQVEGAQLQIAEARPSCCCRHCEARVEVDELAVCCPQCGSEDVYVEGGRELVLQSIELDQ